MQPPTTEQAFESAIECALLHGGPDACPHYQAEVREPSAPYALSFEPGGYHRRTSADYDRDLGGDRLRSVGRPVIGVELRIADDEGNPLPAGAAGEIVVRGPNVSGGYLDRSEETAAAFRDGWLLTGDVGRLDQEGYLYLLDRKKDIIITGGENVWSAEVEAALHAHPDVIEAAVIGVPDETWGEAVLAVIVPAPGSSLVSDVGPQELIAHCRRLIGGYKVPRQFRFIEAMPKSAMGKILKSGLRRRYQEE